MASRSVPIPCFCGTQPSNPHHGYKDQPLLVLITTTRGRCPPDARQRLKDPQQLIPDWNPPTPEEMGALILPISTIRSPGSGKGSSKPSRPSPVLLSPDGPHSDAG